jgi:hypothetical protein
LLPSEKFGENRKQILGKAANNRLAKTWQTITHHAPELLEREAVHAHQDAIDWFTFLLRHDQDVRRSKDEVGLERQHLVQ